MMRFGTEHVYSKKNYHEKNEKRGNAHVKYAAYDGGMLCDDVFGLLGDRHPNQSTFAKYWKTGHIDCDWLRGLFRFGLGVQTS